MLAPVLLVMTLLTAAQAEPTPRQEAVVEVEEEAAKERGIDAIALPIVSFNSDLGVTFGVVGGLLLYAPGYRPYRHSLSLQVSFTTRGQQSHFLRYDGPKLIGPMRLEARLDYRRELLSPYYGAGNESSPDFDGNVTDKRFNYEKRAPGTWVRLRGRPWGEKHPLQSYVGYAFSFTEVLPYEDSVLAQEQPVGIQGGATGQLQVGVLWDSRNDESDPKSGGQEELALRVSGKATGSRYTYMGVTLVERRYWELSSRFVFAQRLALDMLFGDVPFFEWPYTGGLATLEGVGGVSSVRGVVRNRYAGHIKAFANSELRYRVFGFGLFGKPVRVGITGFLDLGRVWQPGVDDGPWYRWHPGVGAGVRLARRAAVVRMDYAASTETWEQRLYFTFGHMF